MRTTFSRSLALDIRLAMRTALRLCRPTKNSTRTLRPGVRGRGIIRLALSALLIWCVTSSLMRNAHAVQRTWAHRASQLWSERSNWEPDDSAPQDGDELIFFDVAAFESPDPMENDIPNLTIKSLSFTAQVGDLFSGLLDWELNANTLTVTESITS